jgi:uncharacterized protein (DUF488 family)
MRDATETTEPDFVWPPIWTVGHSTRSADEFSEILLAHQIKTLADVRSFPASRRYPHFNRERLSEWLCEIGINYHHVPDLGGRRRPQPNSRNTSWRNQSFRAYADYMESEEFAQGVSQLVRLARAARTSIMCAEALWWRCHRSLISDYLKAHGSSVTHIMDGSHSEDHPYTPAARIINGALSYEGLLAEQARGVD